MDGGVLGQWMEESWVHLCEVFLAHPLESSPPSPLLLHLQGNLLLQIHCHCHLSGKPASNPLSLGCRVFAIDSPNTCLASLSVLFELVPSDSNLSAQWRRKWVLVVGRVLLLQFLVLELQQLAASSHGHVGVTKCH